MTRRRRLIGTLKIGTPTSGSIAEEPEKRSGERSASPPLLWKRPIVRIHATGNAPLGHEARHFQRHSAINRDFVWLAELLAGIEGRFDQRHARGARDVRRIRDRGGGDAFLDRRRRPTSGSPRAHRLERVETRRPGAAAIRATLRSSSSPCLAAFGRIRSARPNVDFGGRSALTRAFVAERASAIARTMSARAKARPSVSVRGSGCLGSLW